MTSISPIVPVTSDFSERGKIMLPADYSENYLRSLLSAFKDLIFVFDSNGTILDYLQDETSELLYVPKEQFIGKNHREVLPPHVSVKIDEAIIKIKNGKSRSSFDYQLSLGTRSVWFTAVFSAIHDEFGNISKYLGVIRDITKRKRKELLLQGVLENAFSAYIVFRAIRNNQNKIVDFKWVMTNRQAEKLTGKTIVELRSKPVKGLTDQQWILFDEYIQVIETGTVLDLEYSFEKEHSKVWLHTHATKLEDGVVITIKDITEKKKAELDLQSAIEQLRGSRQRMDLFFTQALSGFFFMMLDEPLLWDDTTDKEAALDYALHHLRFTRVNEALLKQYGATHEQIMKLTLIDFVGHDNKAGREMLRTLYDNKRLHINRMSKRLDGTPIWLEGDYICFTDHSNRILGHFGIQRDTTERRRTEESLRASEERYRLLADNMMDLVALHDPDGTYRYISPSVTKILGYTPEELIGTSPYRLFHTEDTLAIEKESHQKAREGKDVTNIEYRIQRKDGEYIWFSTNTKPITNAAGKVVMLQTVSRDITERIATMHTLEELNHQKSKMFSIIAHDLRGPLASCMGLLNLTQHEVSPEELQKYLRLARKSVLTLYDLLEDLLLWGGSQLDKISFTPSNLDLAYEIGLVVKRFSEMAQSKGITINVDVEDNTLRIYADRDMIRTIIRNLISNAIKFTKPDGRIDIQAKRNNGLIEISVADNGIGIKKEDIEKLFGKTSTFTTYGTNGEKGTGLGLDICKEFVEKHEGEIWVESEFGRGSKFIFTMREAQT